VGEVILVPAVVIAGVWLKQVVAWNPGLLRQAMEYDIMFCSCKLLREGRKLGCGPKGGSRPAQCCHYV
jgi:hypothetical protein